MSYREKNNVTRNDFLQLMMQLKAKGKVDGDDAAQTAPREGQSTNQGAVTLTHESVVRRRVGSSGQGVRWQGLPFFRAL